MDTTVYPDIPAIAEKFKNELYSVQPQAPANPIPDPSKAQKPPTPPPAEGSDLAVLARKLPAIKMSAYFKYDDNFWKVTGISEKGVEFTKWYLFPPQKPEKRTVPIDIKELRKYNAYSGKLQKFVEIDLSTQSEYLPTSRGSIKQDNAQIAVFAALQKLYGENQAVHKFIFTANPARVYAGQAFKKNDLVLVPMVTSLSKVSVVKDAEKQGAKRLIKHAGFFFSLSCNCGDVLKFASGEITKTKYDESKPVIVPYWLVAEADHDSEPNMQFVGMEVEGIEFQVLQNCKAIKNHEQITMPNEKPAKKKPRTSK
jgi:hypothetical protein